MSRDTVKTLSGLVVIGAIVVATFLYGNAQRQSQLKHDQNVKNQQASRQGQSTSPSASASSVPVAAPKSTTTTKPNSGTAPVQSVASNSIQGSKSTSAPGKSPAVSPTAKPKPTATPAGQVAGAATTPVTGGTAQPLPDTGSPVFGGMGLAAIALMLLWLRRSKRSLFSALRGNRSA